MSREGGRTHGGGNAKLGRIKAQAGAAPAVSSRGRKQTQSPGSGRKRASIQGEPEACRRSLRPFLRNFIYLALLLAVFKVYRIEERAFQGRAFQMLVTLALAALPVHYLAPFRWKKPVFVAVSVVGLFWIFGVQVAAVVLALERRS